MIKPLNEKGIMGRKASDGLVEGNCPAVVQPKEDGDLGMSSAKWKESLEKVKLKNKGRKCGNNC